MTVEQQFQNKAYQRLVTENVRDVIWTIDLKSGNFTYFSPSVEIFLGYTSQEAVGLKVEQILTPESCTKAILFFSEELEKQKTITPEMPARNVAVELEHIRKDGSRVWAELNVVFLRDEHGDLSELLGITRDISDRKRAEDALRQSEEKYRSILENIQDGYMEIDLAGNFIFVNNACTGMLGYSLEEMAGMNYRQYTSPETAKKMFDFFHEVYLSGQPGKLMDYEVIRKDGSIGNHEMSVSLIRDLDGKPIGFRGVARDVTKRKRSEEALRQSEEKYRSILDNIEDGYFECDLRGNLTFFNNSFSRIWGYPRDELLGMNNRDYTTEESSKRAYETFSRIYLSGSPGRISDYEIIRKDGTIRILEIYASLMRDTRGDPCGFRGIARDITERKRLENQFHQAQKMESVGTLAGGIAHDFNNLLMGILGNISLMLINRDEQDKDYERLKNIEEYVMRGSELTKRMLGFARGGKYEVKPTDLRMFIIKSSEMFGRTKKEIQIHRKFAEDLWTVEVDQGQMEQVLLNLFVNAWQAMPEGGHLYLSGVNVELGPADVEPFGIEPGRYVKIVVSDTGTGMDETTQRRIFDPFFTTKDRSRGTGLGLASVYGIMKNHGGFITVESSVGEGSSFYLYMPASYKKVKKDKTIHDKIKQGEGKVLLVDDEKMIIDIGTEMLNKMGYIVVTACDGNQAVEMYQANKDTIDLVILDMIMPGIGGGQTYDALKEINAGVKVLLSSGYSRSDQAEEILNKGCNGFIQKPFDMKDLSRKIEKILKKKAVI
ncbi:MAG: PAS domain S-box protein [Deltaproteobacteria bacterium]|nr:PAS domain S-box protein [Deltaproteobacteria bacterium]